MIYLSGAVRGGLDERVGFILTPNMGNHPPAGCRWGADNGCYSQGDSFDLDRYLRWLDKWSPEQRSRCLFATAPDVVADAERTLARSSPVLPLIRLLGYPAALVAQDGLERLPVPWDDFDALFIGGSTEWKLSAYAAALTAEAKRRGKWVHMGRVNSRARLWSAHLSGCDSADGTMIAFGPDVLGPKLAGWLDEIELQGVLPGVVG